MEIKLEIQINADSSYVSEATLNEHLHQLAKEILQQALNNKDDSWNRKVYINYEEQEDINLEITGKMLCEARSSPRYVNEPGVRR